MPISVTHPSPGLGEGWTRLAEAVRASVPPQEVDGIWVFRVLRRDKRDHGTAIVSRVEGDRRRIYTARFALTVKGRSRGHFESELQEVGSGPLEALDELLALVPKRAEDEEPPVAIEVASWFPPGEGSAES